MKIAELVLNLIIGLIAGYWFVNSIQQCYGIYTVAKNRSEFIVKPVVSLLGIRIGSFKCITFRATIIWVFICTIINRASILALIWGIIELIFKFFIF